MSDWVEPERQQAEHRQNNQNNSTTAITVAGSKVKAKSKQILVTGTTNDCNLTGYERSKLLYQTGNIAISLEQSGVQTLRLRPSRKENNDRKFIIIAG